MLRICRGSALTGAIEKLAVTRLAVRSGRYYSALPSGGSRHVTLCAGFPTTITALVELTMHREQLEVKLVFSDTYPFTLPECCFTVSANMCIEEERWWGGGVAGG